MAKALNSCLKLGEKLPIKKVNSPKTLSNVETNYCINLITAGENSRNAAETTFLSYAQTVCLKIEDKSRSCSSYLI